MNEKMENGLTTEYSQGHQSWGPQYLDMSYCIAKVAGMNVQILSLKIIISKRKQEKRQKISRLRVIRYRSTRSVLGH